MKNRDQTANTADRRRDHICTWTTILRVQTFFLELKFSGLQHGVGKLLAIFDESFCSYMFIISGVPFWTARGESNRLRCISHLLSGYFLSKLNAYEQLLQWL